jgi:preprotein translocase subunit SecE
MQTAVRCDGTQQGYLEMAMTNPLQFIQQVRAEVAKVVWPTRREVMLTTVMVFILAALTAVFFAIVDILIRGGLQVVLDMFG